MSDPTVNLNQKIAELVGWTVRSQAGIRYRFQGQQSYTLLNPKGETVSEYDTIYMRDVEEFGTEAFAWRLAPDFLHDLNATSQVLTEYDVTLRLDYGPASAARIIPEGRINEPPLPEFVTHSADLLLAEMSELAARSLLAYLEWKSQVDPQGE